VALISALAAPTRLRMGGLLFRLVGRHRPMALMLTHAVDEALLFTDRAFVMEQGHFTLEQNMALPHCTKADRRTPRIALERPAQPLGVAVEV